MRIERFHCFRKDEDIIFHWLSENIGCPYELIGSGVVSENWEMIYDYDITMTVSILGNFPNTLITEFKLRFT